MFEKYIYTYKDEMIKNLDEIIRIPSKLDGYDNPDYPFGKNVNDVLEKFLSIAKEMGFRVKNINKYCGYVEFGDGEEIVGIIGHLDVVPEGEGWKYPPFELTLDDGKLYGRGTTDDKGPMIASLYAMKVVMDNAKVHKRVRLIIGLNEESDWKCIKYYKEHEELPTIGFSPDADFPCIYAEKALLTVKTESDYIENEKIKIKEIDCKNNRENVVPKYCGIKLESNDEVSEELKELLIKNVGDGISFTRVQNEFYIESTGVQAHAARPELGNNAVSKMIILLNKVFTSFGVEEKSIKLLTEKIGKEVDGKSLGIKVINNELGDLTLNLASIELDDNKIKSTMNLRIPGTEDLSTIKEKITSSLSDLKISFKGEKEALYIPKDNELVKLLCRLYNDYTGESVEPLAIGGATFARAFNNCISFGAMRPNEPDMCHQVDEYITLKNLIDACNMYANAIYELAEGESI